MTKIAVEQVFTGTTTLLSSYDQTKTNLGTLIKQRSQGSNNTDKFVGPMQVGIARPMDASVPIQAGLPFALDIDTNTQWLFMAETSAAAATRKIVYYTLDKNTGIMTWKGFITLTYPAATAHTIKGMKVTRDLYTTGTVSVTSGNTAVTGVSTLFSTDRVGVGARIGFGSTDPSAITQWYDISAIGSDTGLTLATNAAQTYSGVAYVIEEIRVITATTNATTTNGGLYVTKGLHPGVFNAGGTSIPAATTVDNIRAVYWLADAATVTNITSIGLAIEAKTNNQTHNVYVLDSAGTTAKYFKYNIRKNLTLASGKDSTSLVLATGASATLTGTANTSGGNLMLATLSHGAGAGIPSLYFTTTTRVYRSSTAVVLASSTAFIEDAMIEVVPGNAYTWTTASAMSAVEYIDSIDRLLISNGANKPYVTRYDTSGSQFDLLFLVSDMEQDQLLSDSNIYPHPTLQVQSGLTIHTWTTAGITYIVRDGSTAANLQLWACPLGAHWGYGATSGQRLITPVMSCPSATKFYRVYVTQVEQMGSDNLGTQAEPFKIYYRTTGISDNSGAWNLVDYSGSLASVAVAGSIQFMVEFKTIGVSCIPARLCSLTVLYEAADNLPSQFVWAYSDSSLTDGTFGFTQTALFGGSVPNLQIDYYRADTNALVMTQQSTSTTNGVFEYWNGATWVAGTGTDTVNLRRRFRPTSGLPASVNLYANISTF